MRTFVLLLLALPFTLSPASAVGEIECFDWADDVRCDDVAISVFGSANGGFLAVSGFNDATTYMDRCLEWICPSVAVSGFGDAYAECHVSSVCVALAGWGQASHHGYGASVGGCDVLYDFCYPFRESALLA